MNQRSILIANRSFTVTTHAEISLMLDDAYQQFETVCPPRADIEIEVFPYIPVDMLLNKTRVFESHDGEQVLWNVYEHNQGYLVQVFNPLDYSHTLALLVVSSDLLAWQLYMQSTNNTVFPFAYPIGPLLFYYATCYTPAIMIHASGIVDHTIGRMFSGFSGVGKSTMAARWYKAGYTVIQDDRLWLNLEDDAVFMYNTPMFRADIPKKQQLHSLYLLKQTPEHTIREVHGVEAVSRMLAFCIQHSYNVANMQHHIDVVCAICEKIRIYELGVALRDDSIDFIRMHD